tara:strand:+ start:350 stop:538 length:189 start_codon:yes stop_codon:yes gene_type:complete
VLSIELKNMVLCMFLHLMRRLLIAQLKFGVPNELFSGNAPDFLLYWCNDWTVIDHESFSGLG